jgi:hypothetical protein
MGGKRWRACVRKNSFWTEFPGFLPERFSSGEVFFRRGFLPVLDFLRRGFLRRGFLRRGFLPVLDFLRRGFLPVLDFLPASRFFLVPGFLPASRFFLVPGAGSLSGVLSSYEGPPWQLSVLRTRDYLRGAGRSLESRGLRAGPRAGYWMLREPSDLRHPARATVP